MNSYLLVLLSVIILIIGLYLWKSKEGYENVERTYLESQETYYKSRDS